MEQRIGSGSQPLEGAGFDPAFIPGLTSPASAKSGGVQGKEKDTEKDTEDVAEEATAEESPSEETESEQPESADTDADTDADESDLEADGEPAAAAEEADGEADDEGEEAEGEGDDEGDDEEAPVDGPVFEAADRRARIVADHEGVRLSLDDQQCEFRWDEIGAVETEAPRFGKRFTITVHTPDRRWYPIEIEATARSRFKEWDEQLDAVLDAYFEDADAK